MKKRLHKSLSVFFVLVAALGCFFPAGTAAAEIGDEFYLESEQDEWYDSDYENAREILNENLDRTGMTLNEDQRVYDFYGKFSRTELDKIEAWIEKQEDKSDISIRVRGDDYATLEMIANDLAKQVSALPERRVKN